MVRVERAPTGTLGRVALKPQGKPPILSSYKKVWSQGESNPRLRRERPPS